MVKSYKGQATSDFYIIKVKIKFMHLNRIIIFLIGISILFSSCFEKDKAVLPYSGEIFSIPSDIELFASYFDLETGKVVKVNPADSWQLGFECGKSGWHIIVNSGAHWLLKNSHQSEIQSLVDSSAGQGWSYDIESVFPDSTAVGDWTVSQGNELISKKEVYFLGKSSGSKYTSVKQLIFLSVDDSIYTFYYQNADKNISDTVTIRKSDTTNYVYYSFSEKQQVNLEPNKSGYDLVFGPYYDVVTEFSVTGPYLVRGVLINQAGTAVVLDSLNSYASIDSSRVNNYQFSTRRDLIGYNWKEVNVDVVSSSAKYFIKPNYTYIIHTGENNYFKFHFLTYESGGMSGVPQFEYKQIE
jgi:hypothetical protein